MVCPVSIAFMEYNLSAWRGPPFSAVELVASQERCHRWNCGHAGELLLE